MDAVHEHYSVGIDFGTTKSALAYTHLSDTRPVPVIGTERIGVEFMPSEVYITKDNQRLVGELAENLWQSQASKPNVNKEDNDLRFLREFKLKFGDKEYSNLSCG